MILPEFHLPTKLYIKPGIIEMIDSIIDGLGNRIMIITTSSDLAMMHSLIEKIANKISSSGKGCIIYDEIPETPNTEFIDSAVYFAKKTECDLIIGIGGIESINSAKAVALLTTNFYFCEDLFEEKQLQLNNPLPFVTVPFYPLFGFELLPLFYITDIHIFAKKMFKNNLLYPVCTIVDPNIASEFGEEEAALFGIATLAMSTESVISKVTNEFTNTYALKSIDLLFKSLPKAFRDPHNAQHRHPLAISSVLSGIAFATSYLSLTLAIAMAISSKTNIKLEYCISIILPHVMEYNLTSSPGKYVQMAKVMDENVRDITVIEAAIKAVEAVRRIAIDINVPQRLSQYNIAKSEFPEIAILAENYDFVKNAPRPLDKDEIHTILIASY